MTSSFLPLFLSVLLALSGGAAHADKSDRNQPMNVASDALRYDDINQTSVFTGQVVLTKGTILIRGAKLEVRQDAQGNQFGVVTAESGKRAFFKQKREGLDEFIEGEGETIEYNSQADTVKFIGQAQLRRYRGATLNDEFTGAIIVYNNTSEVFTVDREQVKGSSGVPGGRVRAMLTPSPDNTAAPNSAPNAVSNKARDTTAPALRATPALGGDNK